MIKAVIYDLDNLMVASWPLQIEAWGPVLERYGYKIADLLGDKLQRRVGTRVIDFAQDLVKQLKLPVDAKTLCKERDVIFLKLVKERLEMMPGLMYSLQLFKKNKLRLAIASSGTTEYIQIVLEKFNLSGYFEVVVTGDDVKNGKPDPESYIVACKKLHLNPSDCLVLEDATNGILSGKSAGCKVIGVKTNITPPQDRSAADLVLDSLEDLSIEKINSI